MRACFSSKQKQRACFLKFKPFLFHNLENCGNLSSDFSCCLTSLKTSLQKSFSSVSNRTGVKISFKVKFSNLLWIFWKKNSLEEPIFIVKKKWHEKLIGSDGSFLSNWVHSVSVTNRITEKKFWRLKGPILNYGKT